MALSTGSKILVTDISTALSGKQDALGYTPVKSVNGTLADSAGNVTVEAGGGMTNRQVFTASGTFTAPKDAIYIVQLVSGGANGSGTKGGDGGKLLKFAISLKQNDACDITIGAASLGNTTITTPYGNYSTNIGTAMSTGGSSATAGSGGTNENPKARN